MDCHAKCDFRADLAQGGSCLEGEATAPGHTVRWWWGIWGKTRCLDCPGSFLSSTCGLYARAPGAVGFEARLWCSFTWLFTSLPPLHRCGDRFKRLGLMLAPGWPQWLFWAPLGPTIWTCSMFFWAPSQLNLLCVPIWFLRTIWSS